MSGPRPPAGGTGVPQSVSGQLNWTHDTAGAFPSVACLPGLSRHWTRELVERSAIDPAVITERGYQTVQWGPNDRRGQELLKKLGIPGWVRDGERGSGLLIPMYRATGERISAQWKPEKQVRNRDGKYLKYASVRGQTNRLDVHPRNRDRIVDPTVDSVELLTVTTDGNARQRRQREAVCWAVVEHLRSRNRYGPRGAGCVRAGMVSLRRCGRP